MFTFSSVFFPRMKCWHRYSNRNWFKQTRNQLTLVTVKSSITPETKKCVWFIVNQPAIFELFRIIFHFVCSVLFWNYKKLEFLHAFLTKFHLPISVFLCIYVDGHLLLVAFISIFCFFFAGNTYLCLSTRDKKEKIQKRKVNGITSLCSNYIIKTNEIFFFELFDENGCVLGKNETTKKKKKFMLSVEMKTFWLDTLSLMAQYQPTKLHWPIDLESASRWSIWCEIVGRSNKRKKTWLKTKEK